MTIDRRWSSSQVPQGGLEDLLREFYAAEMPAELRQMTGARDNRAPSAGARDTRRPAGSRTSRRLGLTVMLTTLLLTVSAFVLVPSRDPAPRAYRPVRHRPARRTASFRSSTFASCRLMAAAADAQG
jgi:hypothetical protein